MNVYSYIRLVCFMDRKASLSQAAILGIQFQMPGPRLSCLAGAPKLRTPHQENSPMFHVRDKHEFFK
jgi:hypothetical protein